MSVCKLRISNAEIYKTINKLKSRIYEQYQSGQIE